jgi:hypothetical protein
MANQTSDAEEPTDLDAVLAFLDLLPEKTRGGTSSRWLAALAAEVKRLRVENAELRAHTTKEQT